MNLKITSHCLNLDPQSLEPSEVGTLRLAPFWGQHHILGMGWAQAAESREQGPVSQLWSDGHVDLVSKNDLLYLRFFMSS